MHAVNKMGTGSLLGVNSSVGFRHWEPVPILSATQQIEQAKADGLSIILLCPAMAAL
jgi:hypothetical protein